MYAALLILHNLLRWVVLLLALWALFRAYSGWFGKRSWQPIDRRVGTWFTISMDIQLLVGLLLYVVLSPVTQQAFTDFGAAMGDPNLRFFAVEHITVMIVAVIFAHLGSVLSRRGASDAARHQRAAIWFTLALAAVLAGIPWDRPLLRLG